MKRVTVKKTVDWLKENVGDDLDMAFINEYGDSEPLEINMRDEKFDSSIESFIGAECTLYHERVSQINSEDISKDIRKPRCRRRNRFVVSYFMMEVNL